MNFAALSAFAEEFLALRQAVARRDPHRNGRDRRGLKHREKLLRSFIAYWHEQGDPWPIRSSVLLDWVAVGSDRQHPYRDQRRFYVARALLLQVRVFEPATEIPDNIFKPLYRRRAPHLFSDQDIVRLIDAVAQVRPCGNMRPLTFSTLLGLLASTGLRIGEAINLTMEDARLDAAPPHLLIHESKFGKSRYVVLHPSTAEQLRIYRSTRTEILRGKQVQPFFINRKGGRLDYNSQRLAFVSFSASPASRPYPVNVDHRCIPSVTRLPSTDSPSGIASDATCNSSCPISPFISAISVRRTPTGM
ncbi:tyrosine-type recombinase/integrase [Granulicella sp. dw_53]|uniref:tyrosine-type recombinase/integrase n=1 Tax=Granulicella sp. dw_53 TaxID=2719792 RepID=UPI001BD6D6A4|nr:tyrosine-type recombinase/integrase [Granulicella sp. dw_53]